MYRIETTDYGFRITATGIFDKGEADRLREDVLEVFSHATGPFSIIVDVRGRVPLDAEAAEAMANLHKTAVLVSLQRAAIIVDSPVIKGQARQITHKAGTTGIDRVIDASCTPDWEHQATNWAANGIEPQHSTEKTPRL